MLFHDRNYQVLQQDWVGPYLVSTVWLGIDHGFGLSDVPIIFETMVFKGDEDIHDVGQRRYATEEEAFAGHAEVLNEVLAASERGARRRCPP